jgi:signal transduction histidine kinase
VADATPMADHPAADGVPAGEAPLTGPASRIFRYLPDGDPKDRAQRYLGDPDPKERAQRYLTESQITKRPSGLRPATPTPTPAPAPAPAIEARMGNQAQSALHSMVAAVLEERRVETDLPAAFVAPAPMTAAPVAEPAIVAPPAPEPEVFYDEHGPATPAPAPAPVPTGAAGDHLQRLRELSERLRISAVSPDGLQPAVDLVHLAVGADAVVLSLSVPRREQVTSGTTLGGGPRHAVPVRADGSAVGELMACRLTEREPFTLEDETFLALAADQVGALVTRAAAGSALEPGDQQFVNTLVGELRAPLGTVSGLLEDFTAGNAGELTESQHGYLQVAADHTGRLLAIVRDLQTLSRLRRPEPHEMDHIGIGPLLERAAARSRPVAEARGIELVVEESSEALVVKGVPEQLDRAVSAVVDNAVKYSGDGGRVTLAAEQKDGTVRITVADDGIGMDPSDTGEVFERFARARTALEAGIPGVGLGLTIVKEVVDVHGGRAWAESAAGHGTRVHLAIPGAA